MSCVSERTMSVTKVLGIKKHFVRNQMTTFHQRELWSTFARYQRWLQWTVLTPRSDQPRLGGGPACNTQSNFDARVKIYHCQFRECRFLLSNAIPLCVHVLRFLRWSFPLGPRNLAGSNLIRTDIINPCNVARQISCGGLCFTTADLGFVPRFFLANGDTTSTAGSGFVPGDATCAAGQVYLKGLNPSRKRH